VCSRPGATVRGTLSACTGCWPIAVAPVRHGYRLGRKCAPGDPLQIQHRWTTERSHECLASIAGKFVSTVLSAIFGAEPLHVVRAGLPVAKWSVSVMMTFVPLSRADRCTSDLAETGADPHQARATPNRRRDPSAAVDASLIHDRILHRQVHCPAVEQLHRDIHAGWPSTQQGHLLGPGDQLLSGAWLSSTAAGRSKPSRRCAGVPTWPPMTCSSGWGCLWTAARLPFCALAGAPGRVGGRCHKSKGRLQRLPTDLVDRQPADSAVQHNSRGR
jgi:hypothetical protein